MWKTAWHEYSQDTAHGNAAAGNPQWDLDMLMGMGQYMGKQAQILHNPAVYMQISAAAIKAWKTIQGRGVYKASCLR